MHARANDKRPQAPVRAVLFDLDGTLTQPYLDFDQIRAEIGLPEKVPVLEAMEKMPPAERQRANAIVEFHEQLAAENSELFDGVHDTLEGLRTRGLPIGLLTRNSRLSVNTVLARHALTFDTIRSREDGVTKPSPEPIFALCEKLGVAPKHTLSVGDYLFDIQAGAAAGAITVLMIGHADPPPFADQADIVIRDLREILTIVDDRSE